MNIIKTKKNKGFVILYTVIISSIILAIALGIANISLKEIKFGTGARETNEAFFAADTGAECALYGDRTDGHSFSDSGTGTITCLGQDFDLSYGSTPFWSFTLSGLGNDGKGCAKVSVDKTNPPLTTIISKGYNDGGSTFQTCVQGQNSVERKLELNY